MAVGLAENRDDADSPWTGSGEKAYVSHSKSGCAMSSPFRSIGDLTQFNVMFWLPPGGTDNGVWASAWAELADLQPGEVAPVLRVFADADIGAYVATPGGRFRRVGRPVIHRLWVDSLQYHRAEDVLMAYLNETRRR